MTFLLGLEGRVPDSVFAERVLDLMNDRFGIGLS